MVQRGERKIAWLGNTVNDGGLKDGIPIPMNTSLPLPGNLSLDIGSAMVPLLEVTHVFLQKRSDL